ncbi:hypothetical protein GB864_16055, partial [Agromyces sp. MMS17-SY077]|nr:hypothetical protein [Agromyces seonyuensis]
MSDDRTRLLALLEPSESFRPGVLVRTDADAVLAALGREAPAILRIDGFVGGEGIAFSGIARATANRDRELAALPDDQQDAIAVVSGRLHEAAPKAPLVGLALREFVRAAAGPVPLLLLVDRPQSIDGDSLAAFASVARHPVDGVAVVFALGGGEVPELLDDLPELALDVDEAELHDGRDAAALDAVVAGLPRAAREWLIIAAAEPERDLERVGEAALSVGLEADAPAPAMLAGLVDVWTDAVFTSQSAYDAVRRAADGAPWRDAHRLLWQTAAAREDADRLAWHLSQSLEAADDRVANRLEASAERAAARGAYRAAAVLLETAARCAATETRRADCAWNVAAPAPPS